MVESTLEKAFKSFELEGWEKSSGAYHDHFGDVTGQTMTALLDAAKVGKGSRVLDVATGPGHIAAAAAERGAEVTGIDFSTAQVALASKLWSGLLFQQGDAENLSFPDGTFDAVVINFGILHFPAPERAIAEAHRVLKPGGRFAFTVWSTPDKAIGLGLILNAIQEHGDMDVPLPPGPSFFRFSDFEECRRCLGDAGFTDIEVGDVAMHWDLATADGLFAAAKSGTVRTAALLEAQAPAALQAIEHAITENVQAFARDGGYRVPMSAALASAAKS